MGDNVVANEQNPGACSPLCKLRDGSERWPEERKPILENEKIESTAPEILPNRNPVQRVDRINKLLTRNTEELSFRFLLRFSWKKELRVLTFERDDVDFVTLFQLGV